MLLYKFKLLNRNFIQQKKINKYEQILKRLSFFLLYYLQNNKWYIYTEANCLPDVVCYKANRRLLNLGGPKKLSDIKTPI